MARYSSLRASDADRDAVADRLRNAAVEGRLEHDELEERLDAALRARTYGDLHGLLTDLPGKPVARERRTAEVAPVARIALVVAMRALLVLAVIGVVLVVAALTAAWWVLWALVWLSVRAGRGCNGRLGRNAGWHRPPHARRV
jgi:Domain of unknown function (DUF1707)